MTRTPRQTPGEGLVALTLMVPPATKAALAAVAAEEQRSLSQVGRMAIEGYLGDRERLRDVLAG